jgi:TRAP-type C4-dicarboxylate transport system permease large subunit
MVKVNSNPQPGEGTVWFDYFLVTDPTITSTTPLTPSSTSPPIINAHQSSVPVGAIVGGVIGGLVLILVFFVLVFYCRRREKSALQQPDNSQSTF